MPSHADLASISLAILGGTGDQGRGLAYRFARAGHRVLIGSRKADRGKESAAELAAMPAVDPSLLSGDENAVVSAAADLVIAAVPYEGHAATLQAVEREVVGKIVVDCVNPLGFDNRGAYALEVAEGSAAEQAAALLPQSRVVAAFHHVSAVLLADPEVPEVDTDVMVLGDDREATDLVVALAGRIPGMGGVYAGRLRNARQVEALTANLISVNRRYKTHAGVRVTGT